MCNHGKSNQFWEHILCEKRINFKPVQASINTPILSKLKQNQEYGVIKFVYITHNKSKKFKHFTNCNIYRVIKVQGENKINSQVFN